MRSIGISTRIAVLAAALVALAVSVPSLGHDFVYDDVHIVADRDVVHEGDLPTLLTEPYWPTGALWRPGTLLAFSAQWTVGGGGPGLFHGVNVLLYGLIAGLVALLGSRLFTPPVGLTAGVLFAAHPVHVEVFANVVGQAELLSAACYLGVLLLAWHAQERRPQAEPPSPEPSPQPRPPTEVLIAAGLLTLVGLSAKEHVVTLPGALLVLWWLGAARAGRPIRDIARGQWRLLAAILLPIGVYLLARAHVLGGVAGVGGLPAPGLDPDSLARRVVVMLPVSLEWIRLLFWPVHLSADYSPAQFVPWPDFGAPHAAALVVWLGVLGLAWHVRDRIPSVTAGVALFAVTISVGSNVIVPLEILLAERLLFLPSVGWALALGGVAQWAASLRGLAPVAAAVAAVTLLLGGRSLERVPVWSDNDTFFARMAQDAPLSYRVSRLEAERALAAGDTTRADELWQETIARNPYDPRLPERLGMMYLGRGRYDLAAPYFLRTLETDTERRGALQGLAISLTRLGQGGEALRWIDHLEEIHGTSIEVLVLRIEALRAAERYRESVHAAEAALQSLPEDWNLHLMAAESARLGGLCEIALRHVEEGIQKAPDGRRGRFEEIRRSIEEGEISCHP